MKKVVLILALIFFEASLNGIAFGAPITYTHIYKSGGGGPWWCFWCSDNFGTTSRTEKWGWDENCRCSTHEITIICTGNGMLSCPTAITNGGEGGEYDPFIDLSTQMMEEYVTQQVEEGNYSGHADFDTIYEGQQYLRNVTWDGSPEEVTVTMVIVPVYQ